MQGAQPRAANGPGGVIISTPSAATLNRLMSRKNFERKTDLPLCEGSPSDHAVELERPVKRHATSGSWLELTGNTILALSGLALSYYLWYFHPVGYLYFVTEDYWVEYATFVSLAMACCVLTWTLVKHRDARKPGIALLDVYAFFVAMEKISENRARFQAAMPAFPL